MFFENAKRKIKRKVIRVKEKQEQKIEKTKMGGGRVPTQLQLNLRGPGASAALVISTPNFTKFLNP